MVTGALRRFGLDRSWNIGTPLQVRERSLLGAEDRRRRPLGGT